MPRTASRRRSAEPDDERDDYLDDHDDGSSRRGRRRDEDDEDERDDSRRRTRRNRFADGDADEPDEDERPRRRRESLDDHPGGLDEFAPRSSRRSRSEEPREERRGRGGRGDRDREERSGKSRSRGRDDREERGRSRGGRGGRTAARQGWGGYRQTANSVGNDFANNLKIIDNTDMLIKVLDEEPVASYAEHWLTVDDKRRSYVCLGEDCPICDRLGDRPSVKVCMNVADMDVNPPEVKIWTFGTQVGDTLEKFAENPKTSPVNREDIYWTITRTKKNDRYNTTVRPVKARDLVEDFDTDPLTDEELDELEGKCFEQDQIFTVKSRADLLKVIKDNDLDDAY